ncbi:DUF3575 domain-containing protein [Bacteroides ovatus]|nr:DUF3575 domain-containing protein [Bacteroides ovatus]
MLGGIVSKDTGYQGKLWNAGVTLGYQLSLSRSFSLDFNLVWAIPVPNMTASA